MHKILEKIASELELKIHQVTKTIQLLFEEECTVPFIARYRKEMTGTLDEIAIRSIRDRYQYLTELEESREKYLKVVKEHCDTNPAYKGQFEALKAKFLNAETRQALDDLYLPFKPKRRTRATIAKEKGLEPLLTAILERPHEVDDLATLATSYLTTDKAGIDPKLQVKTIEEALKGAMDIYAERVAEAAEYRQIARKTSEETGELVSKLIEDEKVVASRSKKVDPKKYETYFDYREPIQNAPSHRVMAVRRGESEKVLRMTIDVDRERILAELVDAVLGDIAGEGAQAVPTDTVRQFLVEGVEDGYKRLMAPSIETELRLNLKGRAEEEAIRVFSKNLSKLLLLPPIPNCVVLGIDPGLRTGSKLAVCDETGKPLYTGTIYPQHDKPNSPKNADAKTEVQKVVKEHGVKYLAIGNGTGSKEIDKFVTTSLKEAGISDIKRVVVNEAGASVYSTEDVAREEFPDLDATLRSAISIARRLQDPLAELVKINPRSIGVGQYQHDVNPTKLSKSLEEVVESCVNKVGVNLNTASYKLLGYVSGVGPSLAKSIVAQRNSSGSFSSRAGLLEVSGFGPKAFQQAAGFLRVAESQNPLDNSSVHPEQYEIVEKISHDLGKPLSDIIGRASTVESIQWEQYVNEQVGMPTLLDISAELIKPGRDPREDGSRLTFSDAVSDISDLSQGMKLRGTVTNVTNFGAFVDIGVHQDGLVHISALSDDFVRNPEEVVAVGDILNVTVIDVDKERRRISLSAKSSPEGSEGKGQGGRRDKRRDGPSAGGQRQRSHGRPKAKKKKDPSYTLDDLMSKFGKS